MGENPSYEDKVEAIRKAALEAARMRPSSPPPPDMGSQRRELDRMDKIGAFQAGVRDAVKQWLTDNKAEVLEAIGGKGE